MVGKPRPPGYGGSRAGVMDLVDALRSKGIRRFFFNEINRIISRSTYTCLTHAPKGAWRRCVRFPYDHGWPRPSVPARGKPVLAMRCVSDRAELPADDPAGEYRLRHRVYAGVVSRSAAEDRLRRRGIEPPAAPAARAEAEEPKRKLPGDAQNRQTDARDCQWAQSANCSCESPIPVAKPALASGAKRSAGNLNTLDLGGPRHRR